MAFEKAGETLPRIVSNGDLTTTGQYRFVTINSSGKAVLAGAGAVCAGVLQNKPDTDEACTIWGPGTVTKVTAGGTVTAGMNISSDASGDGVESTSADFIHGIALTDAADTELFSVFITQPGVLA